MMSSGKFCFPIFFVVYFLLHLMLAILIIMLCICCLNAQQASGNVTLDTVNKIGQTGVTYISR